MYKQHFGLSNELFEDGIASDTGVYYGPRQKVLAANLTIALNRRDSVAGVYGAAGTGKTTTVSYALREMTTRLALGTIAHPPVTPHELLEQLLCEFGFSPYKNSRTERLQMWRQFLSEMAVTETRVCILIEAAQSLDLGIFKALDTLTAADANGCPGANVVLTAASAPEVLLSSPELAALRQRMRLQTTLRPFSVDEIRDYLAFKVEGAGGAYASVFADDAADAIHAFSGGIVRVVNNIVESALSIAATRREPRLTAALVTRVAVGLFGIPAAQATSGVQPGDATQATTMSTNASPAPAAPRDGAQIAPPPEPTSQSAPTQAASLSGAVPTAAATPAYVEPTTGTGDRSALEKAAATSARPAALDLSGLPRRVATRPKSAAAPTASTPPLQPSETPATAATAGLPEASAEDDGARKPETATDTSAATLEGTDGALDVPTLTDSIVIEEEAESPHGPADGGLDDELTELDDIAGIAAEVAELEETSAGASEAAPGEATGRHAKFRWRAETNDIDPGFPEPDAIAEGDEEMLELDPTADGDEEVLEFDAIDDSDDRIFEFDENLDGDDEIPELNAVADFEEIDTGAAAALRGPGKAADTSAMDPDLSQEDLVEAFANARALEDISNSMAETLFGDAELEQLAATLSLRAAEFDAGTDPVDSANDAPAFARGARRP